MRIAALTLALAGVVGYALTSARLPARDVTPAVAEPRPERSPPSTPYWSLERRFLEQEHRLGGLGREVRALRRANHRLGSALASLRGRQRRTLQALRSRPYGSDYAIRLAASAFGVSETEMRSVASCETGGTMSPVAYNAGSGASGLLQFLPSTWAAQGLAGFDVFDPVANALAAARIVAREGWRQWSCAPR